MVALKNTDNLNDFVRKQISWFCNELVSIHGDEVLSICVYDSASEKEFCKKGAVINILIIFKSLGIGILEKSLKLVKKGIKKKIVAPLFLTEEHMRTSCDTFPIEFVEMRDKHLCVYGNDPFDSLQIDTKNLRLQCEEKAKSLLIKLRQSYLEIGLAKRGIEKLVHESFRSVLPLFRSVLRIKGEAVPSDEEKVIMQVASLTGLSPSVLMMILKDKEGDEKIGGNKAVEFLGNYLTELQKLAQYIDAL